MNFHKGINGLWFVVLLLTSLMAMAGQNTTSTSTNVTTVIHDYASDGITQLLLRSDDYSGSGQATYTSNSAGSLSSSITSGGEWQLFMAKAQTLRAVWITPNDPIGSEPPAPPAGYNSSDVSVRSKCFDQNGNIVPLANVTTSSGNCTLAVTFYSGGTTYKLLMSPFPFSAPGDAQPTCPSTGCSATGLATVTCNALNINGQCVNWTIVPNTSGPNPTIANLYWYSSSRKSATWVYIGQYYNTFQIDVTNP